MWNAKCTGVSAGKVWWLFGTLLVTGLLEVSSAQALALPCQHEDVLAEVAASFLLRGRSVDPAQLLPEARSLGFDGVAVHAHEGQDDAALVEWLKLLSERADGP